MRGPRANLVLSQGLPDSSHGGAGLGGVVLGGAGLGGVVLGGAGLGGVDFLIIWLLPKFEHDTVRQLSTEVERSRPSSSGDTLVSVFWASRDCMHGYGKLNILRVFFYRLRHVLGSTAPSPCTWWVQSQPSNLIHPTTTSWNAKHRGTLTRVLSYR